MKTILRKIVALLSILAWVMLASWMAYGATYNFYFNNTEQGNNSTASPSLTVTDGEAVKSGGTEQQQPGQTEQQQVQATSPGDSKLNVSGSASSPVASSSQTTASALVQEKSLPRFRFIGAGVAIKQGHHKLDELGSGLNLAYKFTPAIALNAFVGDHDRSYFGGAEAELRLIQLTLGRFDNLIDASLLAGASSLGAVHGNNVSVHAGIRGNLNFGEQWGLTAAIRGNLGYVMAEGGLAIHL